MIQIIFIEIYMLRSFGYRFSNAVQRSILSYQGNLKIRNSQLLEVNLPIFQKNQSINLQISMSANLNDLANLLKQKIQISNIVFLCNDHQYLPPSTPVEVLLNRYFYITSNEYMSVPVEGQYFDQIEDDEIVEGLRNLQLPAITQKEVEQYLKRIDQWIQMKYGKTIIDDSLRLPSGEAAQIFVDSMIQPEPQERNIQHVERQWEKVYWELEDMKEKKRKADEICMKKARFRMSFGLFALAGNIGFIWSGTYLYWSWDIVQPLAYFLSSFGGIVLTYQYFKIGKPYSNRNYLEYLTNKYSEKVYKEIGFSEAEYKEKQYHLKQLQAVLKDYFIKRL